MGTCIYYRLAAEEVEQLWSVVRAVAAEQVAGIERLAADYLGEREDLEAISREELMRRLKTGDVTVIDVRPEPEYLSGHVRGARSVPHSQLRRHLASLPKDLEIVAYCRGPYCVYVGRSGPRAAAPRPHRTST